MNQPKCIAITHTPVAARLVALVGLLVALGLMASGCGIASKTHVEQAIAGYHKQHVQPALKTKAHIADMQALQSQLGEEIGALGQALQATTQKYGRAIDAVRAAQKTESEQLSTLATKVTEQGRALGTLQATARQLSERVAPISATVATLDGTAQRHGQQLGTLDSMVTTHGASIKKLGQRVATIGKTVNQTAGRIGAIEHHAEVDGNAKFVRIPGFPVARRDASDDRFVACAEVSPQMKGEIEKVAEAAKNDGWTVGMVYGFADSSPFKKAGKIHPDSDTLNTECAEMRAAAGAELLAELMEDTIELRGMGTTDKFGEVLMNRTLLVKLVRIP